MYQGKASEMPCLTFGQSWLWKEQPSKEGDKQCKSKDRMIMGALEMISVTQLELATTFTSGWRHFCKAQRFTTFTATLSWSTINETTWEGQPQKISDYAL